MTLYERLLTKILDCGTSDLAMLEDIGYDLDFVVEGLMEENALSLNGIFSRVFVMGAKDLKERYAQNEDNIRSMIKDTLKEAMREWKDNGGTERDVMEYGKYADAQRDLELLEKGFLDPEEGMYCYVNCLDTHVYMKHIGFYRRWMASDVECVEDGMGFRFREE